MKIFQLIVYRDQLQQQIAKIKETTGKLVEESVETCDHQQHVVQVQEQLRQIQQTKECVHDCQEVWCNVDKFLYIFLSQAWLGMVKIVKKKLQFGFNSNLRAYCAIVNSHSRRSQSK